MSETETVLGDDVTVGVKAVADGSWAYSGNRFWAPTEVAIGLPAGVYAVGMSTRIGAYLDRQKIVTDSLIDLPGHGCDAVVDEIAHFWTLKPAFEQRGMVHKRGVLLYGPPGSGKSSIVKLLIRDIVEKQGGVVILTPSIGSIAAGLTLIRSREPNRPILVVLEDVDGMVRGGDEAHLLSLLDGEHQVSGVVFVATTNHIDRLPDRLVCRPSRFDLVMEVGMPNADARASYLMTKEPSLTAAEVTAWVGLTDGFSVAHLRELIILARCYQMPVQTAVERLRKLLDRKIIPA